MTATYTKNGMATLDRTAEATLTPLPRAWHTASASKSTSCPAGPARGRGEVTLLDAVSFTLSVGELVAIVGPSGAGKTTLLEAIAGIAPATSGSVRFDGIDMHTHPGTFRNVLGFVPQEDIIHADLSLQRTLQYSGAPPAPRLRQPGPRLTTLSVTPSTPSA